MPASIKLQQEFGDDLQVVFVESQGASADQAVGFAYGKKWMGTSAMWTTERPFDTGASRLPNFALVSADGKLLMKGNPLAMQSAIEEAITAEVRKGKDAPDHAPKSVSKAWKAFAKGDYAKAVAEAQKIVAAGGDEASGAQAALDTFERRIGAKVDQVGWLVDNGYFAEASDRVGELTKATKGLSGIQDRLSALAARLAAPEVKTELDAAQALAKLERQLNTDGPEDKLLEKIEKLVSKHAGTKAAERARKILAYLAAA